MSQSPSNQLPLFDLSTWAWLKRRLLSRRVHLYIKLHLSHLSVHTSPTAPVEWHVDVTRATITRPAPRLLILLLDTSHHIYIFLPTRRLTSRWLVSLIIAAARPRFEDRYVLCDKLGEGAFASVYSASPHGKGDQVAVKVVHRQQFEMQSLRELQREMAVARKLRHPHIVRVREVFDSPDVVHLVMDLMPHGSLKQLLMDRGSFMSETTTRKIAVQLVHALAHLHSKGFVHRDVKLENVLVRCLERDIQVALGDFGYVNFANGARVLRSLVGTPVYVAPEIIKNELYGAPVDMYAMGVLLYRMLSSRYPFDAGDDDEETMRMCVNDEVPFHQPIWSQVSDKCQTFIRSCLEKSPDRRMTAEKALSSDWLKGLCGTIEDDVIGSPVTQYGDESVWENTTTGGRARWKKWILAVLFVRRLVSGRFANRRRLLSAVGMKRVLMDRGRVIGGVMSARGTGEDPVRWYSVGDRMRRTFSLGRR